MKIDLKTIIIGSLCVIIVIFVMRGCADSGEKMEAEKEKAYRTNIAILESEKREAKAQVDSIVSKQQSDTERIKVVLSVKDIEIQALKSRVIVKRVVIQPLIDSIPDLRAFVSVQDSLIQELHTENDTLKQALYMSGKNFVALNVAHDEERRISERMLVESLARV